MPQVRKGVRITVAILFFVLSIRVAYIQWRASLTSNPIRRLFKLIAISPVLQGAAVDYAAGTLFIATYVAQQSIQFLYIIPPYAVAFLIPLLGPWLPLLYLAGILASAESVSTLVPVELSHTRQHAPGVLVAFVSFGSVLLCYATIAAHVFHSFVSSSDLYFDPLARAMLEGAVAELCFVIVFVIVRENSFCRAVPWLVTLLVLGHAGTCIYTLYVCAQAARDGLGFRDSLLAKRHSQSVNATITDQVQPDRGEYSAV